MSESDEDLINALEESTDPKESPVATPADVAEQLEIGAESVRQRLIRLAADDVVATRKVGRSRVFWLLPVESPGDDREIGRAPDTRDVKDIVAAEECLSCGWSPAAVILTQDGWECYNCGHDPDEESTVPEVPRADHGGGTTDDFDPNADVDELLQEESDDDLRALADVETPPQPTRDEFEEAALAAFEYLREEGGATKSEFQKSIHDDYTARYENQRTWWRKVVKPALKAHPDIETPPKGASTWRFRE